MSDCGNNLMFGLWNDRVEVENYGNDELYQQHLFDQYKMFVGMADEISARRNLANTFFLSLHTFLIGVGGFLYEKGPVPSNKLVYLFPLLAVLSLCYVWYRLLLSYRQLNTAKFAVIAEYEKKLPSQPYSVAEWNSLGRGEDPKLYRPLTDVEKLVPILFAITYIGLFAFIVYA